MKGGLYSSSFWFAINKDKFDKLDPAAKKAIMDNGGEAFARMAGAGWDKADADGLALAKENKNTYGEASPEFVAELTKLTGKIEADYAAKLDKLGLPGKQVIADYRAELAKIKAGN